MGNTLATMRTNLRALLNDNVGLQMWTDAALNQALYEAIAEHSFEFPRIVRAAFSVSDGATAIPLFAVDTFKNPASGVQDGPTSATQADIIGVLYVELPTYNPATPTVPPTPIISDPRQIADPALTGSTRYLQAWHYRGGILYLRNPAKDLEVGAATLLVEMSQTYNRPDEANAITWDGPIHDGPLIYLLAQRSAYQQLAAWVQRDLTRAKAAGFTNIPTILLTLETEISRAMLLRQKRGLRSRTMDI